MNTLVCLLLALPNAGGPKWFKQSVATDADFRGVCVVKSEIAWVSGTRGTYARTTDGGRNWQVGTVPGAEKLDFRDVEAFGGQTAYLLSIGPGESSRIYKTTDAGKNWVLQFKNADPDAFYDAIACWDERSGVALSDPVKGKFCLIITEDGGATWKPLPSSDQPAALKGEGAFAASGTCLVTRGRDDVWFVTGGAKAARVFHSRDRGRTWTVSESPVGAGQESAGIFSIGWKDDREGVVVGGDYRQPTQTGPTAAITRDGGHSWKSVGGRLPFRSGVAWAKDRWVAVGTSGSHQSFDGGLTWQELDRENYNAIGFSSSGEGWAVGPKGRVAKFVR